ncbi:MAG: formyl transferase [Acidimicrobiales bacterium]
MGEVLGTGPFPAGVRNHIVPSTNGDATLKLLEGLEPDVLCVYGTAIVSDRLLARARRVALNLHTGISPRYRGADCYFWPLVRDEPQYVGATVHVCTSDIDGGHIYSTARARLEPDDGVRALFARTVAVGAELYAQVVTDILSGVATATPQELTHGVEYRVAMRTWRHELAVWVKLRRGLVRDYVAAGQPAEWNCEPSR